MSAPLPLSLIDFCHIYPGETAAQSMARSVDLAQRAEALGYSRIWYSEHHNMKHIASSAPAVLIAHIGARTEKIRLGSGGVMLPNHAPLTIAEQFGTLAELHPGRIDLGLGRAPGADQVTMQALRRGALSAETFPEDVLELQGYLTGRSRVPGVKATPGHGTNVPLYILGSSLYGAQLAAALGLPYGFASHFAPQALRDAVAIYRRQFRPSEQLAEPYVIAGVNVIASDTQDDADAQFLRVRRARVGLILGRDQELSDEDADAMAAWNATQAPWPPVRNLPALLEAQALATPARIALRSEGATLDYAQLEARANRVAPRQPTLGATGGKATIAARSAAIRSAGRQSMRR